MMTVKQVAKQLQVSQGFVYRLCATGVLESVRIGSRVRIPEDSLARYIANQKRSTERSECLPVGMSIIRLT